MYTNKMCVNEFIIFLLLDQSMILKAPIDIDISYQVLGLTR